MNSLDCPGPDESASSSPIDNAQSPSAADRESSNQQSSSPTAKKKRLLIGLVACGVFAGVTILLVWLYASGNGFDSEFLAYMPANTKALVYDDLDRIFNDAPRYRKVVESEFTNDPRSAPLAAGGIGIDDISQTLMGLTDDGHRVKVFRLKKPIDQTRATLGGTELKAGNSRYWKLIPVGPTNTFIAFAGESLVIVASTEELMVGALTRAAGKVVVSDTCKKLMGKVSSARHWYVRDEMKAEIESAGRIDHADLDARIQRAMRNLRGEALKMNVTGNLVTVTKYTLCRNSDDADSVVEFQKRKKERKVIDREKKMSEAQRSAMRRMLEGTNIIRSGDYAETSAILDITPWGDDLDSALKQL